MTSLLIGPYTYDVYRVDPADFESEKWGDIRHDRQQIRILQRIDDQVALVALMHESLHGMSFSVGSRYDEAMIIELSHSVVEFLERNGVDLTPLKEVVGNAETLNN